MAYDASKFLQYYSAISISADLRINALKEIQKLGFPAKNWDVINSIVEQFEEGHKKKKNGETTIILPRNFTRSEWFLKHCVGNFQKMFR